MKKLESLEKLSEWGFNILNYVAVKDEYELNSVITGRSIPDGKISIRTQDKFRPSFRDPFGRNLSKENAEAFVKQYKSEYIFIVYESLDPKDCIVKGCIGCSSIQEYVEFIEGPGIVRDIESKRSRHHKFGMIGRYIGITSDSECLKGIIAIDKEFKDLRIFMEADSDFVVEWSYYKYPVGIKHERLLLWEIRV